MRWRFWVGALTVAGLTAGLLLTQAISLRVAALCVCWPLVVLVAAAFLATGSTASDWQTARRVRSALMWKEWREQRWRFLLGTLVVTGLLASLMRAQVIPPREAALFVCWPVGILMTIFLAMGSVAAERADRTWEFLVARPVARSEVLQAKWLVGALQLTAMMLIATAAGMLALWSRTRFCMPLTERFLPAPPSDLMRMWVYDFDVLYTYRPVLWLGCCGLVATLTLLCCYTPLFFILARARNEFTAALGGILLAIVAHAWVLQIVGGVGSLVPLTVIGSLSPLSPMLLHPAAIQVGLSKVRPESIETILALWPVHLFSWLVIPPLLARRYGTKAVAS